MSEQIFNQLNFEVIVVNDGGSTVEAVVAGFKDSLDIQLINQENAGPAQARNRGAMAAQGDFIAYIDDDCRPSKNWIQQLSQQCKDYPNCLIGGKTINALTSNVYSTASQMIVDLAYQYHNPTPSQACFFASNNMIFPRQMFLEVGGFNPNFRTSEDREICDRWLRQGYAMLYADSIQLYHAHALTLSSFWKQHFSYGQGAWRYHAIRSQRSTITFRPDFTFQKWLVSHPFKCLPLILALRVACLMLLSQLASFTGYCVEKIRSSGPLEEAVSPSSLPMEKVTSQPGQEKPATASQKP